MTPALQALAALTREAAPPMTPLQRMRGLQAVALRREAGARRRRALVVASALSVFGVVTAGAIGLVLLRHGTALTPATDNNPIAFRVEGGEIGAGGYLRSADGGGGGVGLHFVEGTELRLAAGARGRLTSVDSRGARFAIEQGEARVSVTARPDARWLIDAGPFLITVHGTVFTAAWDGAAERLDIKMKNGLVSVTGPVADGMIAVRAGQRLTINVQNREVRLWPNQDAPGQAQGDAPNDAPNDAIGAAPPVAPAASEAGTPEDSEHATAASTNPRAGAVPPSAVAPKRVSPSAFQAPAHTSRNGRGRLAWAGDNARDRAGDPPTRSWTAALAAGDLQGILREAEQRGLQRSLSESHSDELAALADAARYLRREDIARQALIAQRDRFPRTDRAHEAAFLLGRLSETGTDGDARALAWYNRYLSEAPSGEYASEALGRKMTATEKLNGLAAAREIARDYLRRFPRGTYAGAARAMSNTP